MNSVLSRLYLKSENYENPRKKEKRKKLNFINIFINKIIKMVNKNNILLGSQETIFNDRIFWIYLIVTLFFIIIGISYILSYSTDNNYLLISFFWLFSNICLLISIYHMSILWNPSNDCDDLICLFDDNYFCFQPNNRTWLFINIIYIILLFLSIMWTLEITQIQPYNFNIYVIGIVILLLSILLSTYCIQKYNINSLPYYKFNIIPFTFIIIYILIWLAFTLICLAS